MKKILFLLLITVASYGQTYPTNPTKFGKISLNTNGVSTSTTKINTQESDGQINYIDAVNLPVPTSVINAIKQKADLSTGLLKNGLISINADPTKFNISAGIGIISNFTDPENPLSTIINFPAFTAVTPTYLTTGNITYIAINSTPSVIMQASPFTPEQRRDLIVLGAVVHSNLTNINVVNNISAPSNAVGNQLHDFIEAVGALNLTGNKYSANGANLALNKSAGTIFKFGVNFANDWKNPHEISQLSETALTFRYRTQNGTEGTDRINLNPALYDLNNVLTSVPNNKFTIQTVTMFQTGLTRIQYGQNVYDDIQSAQAAIFTRDYNVESNIKENGVTRAYIIVKNNATSLLNTSDSRIVEAQKFGGIASGGVALTFANVVSALGYTPENIANKATNFTTVNNTLYPSVQATKNYVDLAISNNLPSTLYHQTIATSSGTVSSIGTNWTGTTTSLTSNMEGGYIEVSGVGIAIISSINVGAQTFTTLEPLISNVTNVPFEIHYKAYDAGGDGTIRQFRSSDGEQVAYIEASGNARYNGLRIDSNGNVVSEGFQFQHGDIQLRSNGEIISRLSTLTSYTVATLPIPDSNKPAFATVNDALDPVNGTVVVGGGTETIPVFYNGNAWVVANSYGVPNTKSTTPIVGGALNARMCVSNGILYVTEYNNNKVGVFSLENPMSPTKIYDFATGANPRHVLVSGRNLFVSCFGSSTVEVWDIQNPESAMKIGEIPVGFQPKMFELIGPYLFVACGGANTVEKYKITMPDSSLSNFSYYKMGEVAVGLSPLALSYNGDGLLAVCGNGDNVIKILSTDDLNVASSASFGGAGHGTCAWFNKTQLLVTDWTTESLLSIDYSNLSTPVLSSSITVSENPEQIEIIGNKAYIPSLRIAVSPSYLDFIDLSNAKLPVKIKSETLTVNGAGFTAPYTDGVNTYLYVDGHEAPFNIDAIRIDNGDFHRTNLMEDNKYINTLGVANLSTTTVDDAKKYTNTTNPHTVSGTDNVLRLTGGTTTMPNPNSVRDGKIITLSNASNAGNVTVSNPFLGAPSFTLYPYESITLQAAKSGSSYAWDAIGGRRNLPSIYDIGGSVGIGTVTPSSYLNYRFLSLNGLDGSVYQLRKNDVVFAEIGGDGVFVNYDTFGGAYSKFSISGVEKLRIDGSNITSSVPIVIPNATASNEAVNKGQLDANSRPYKVYTALLTQTSTGAPVAIILENTLGGTLVWSRLSTGIYEGTLSGAFTVDKTSVSVTNGSTGGKIVGGHSNSLNTIEVASVNSATSTSEDDVLFKAFLEIRVYNFIFLLLPYSMIRKRKRKINKLK